jgi:hypothetical protein
MKSKVLVGLLATLLILTFAPSSFAQVQVRLINTPTAGEADTDRNAQTSTPATGAGILISGEFLASSNLSTTSLTLSFPADITAGVPTANLNPSANGQTGYSVPTAADAIRLVSQSGIFSAVSAINTVDYDSNTITIVLPAVTGNTGSGSVTLVGVRIDASQLSGTGPFNVTGTLSSSANGYLPTDLTEEIITSVADGLAASIGSATGRENFGTFTLFTNRSVPDSRASVRLAEGFGSAFRTATQYSTDGTSTGKQGTKIKLTFAGVPSGLTLSLGTQIGTSQDLTVSLSGSTITTSTLEREITVTASDLDDVENLMLDIVPQPSTSTSAAFAAGDITVTVTLAPTGNGLDADTVHNNSATPTTTGGYPRFLAENTTLTVGTITSASTTLLIPYAVVDNSILYDTGISLANTSKDPFTTGSATQTAGTVKVTVFPRTDTGAGTSFSFTTSSTKKPGQGLSTDGTLAAGSTWTVLLSQIMTQEAVTGPLTGYIFLETNFLNAHGITFVTDFGAGPFNFTSFSPMLVLQPPSQTSRSAATAESLSF